MKAIAYAAKSTEDVHGSIPTQLADCRAAIEQEGGRTVAAEYSDEAATAYRGNRGQGLSDAKDAAIRAATEDGAAELWVQHSDRLARGDGVTADHLAEVWFALRRHGVRLRSVQDDSNLEDAIRVVLIGERNHEDSRRKGAATAVGHRRRFESGKRLGGPIPDGYKLVAVLDSDGRPVVGRDGRAVREAALDPARAPIWRRIFDMVEQGHTCGEVQRTLNAEGSRKPRGGQWKTRDIRGGVLNPFYAGRVRGYDQVIDAGHPPLIEPDRWERIAAMVRTDEKAAKGGRPALAEGAEYLLRGIANCGRCGEPLYTRRLAAGRHYCCKAVREARGTCDAPHIEAEAIERAVLHHLDSFVADLDDWLLDQIRQADAEREQFADAIDQQRQQLARSARRVERAQAVYERAMDDENDDRANVALDELGRLKREHADHAERIAEAERRLAEWPTQPQVDHALDVYGKLRDAVVGRVEAAETVPELNAILRAALGTVLIDTVDGKVYGWFSLRVTEKVLDGSLPHTIGLIDMAAGPVWHKWFVDTPPPAGWFDRTGEQRLADSHATMPVGYRAKLGRGRLIERREEPATTC